jgi:hypothetical protein
MRFLQGISQKMMSVAGRGAEDFNRVRATLATARDEVREALQALTAEAINKILTKLDKQELLAPDERNLVGLWIVGDAEGYTKMEDDFQEWLEEFRRLSGVLESYTGRSLEPQNLVEAYGVLEDAIRVAADIAFFLEKKERLERFNAAINSWTEDDCKIIASMLRSMMARSDM